MKIVRIKGRFKIKEIYRYNFFERKKYYLISDGFYELPHSPRYFESFIPYGSKGFSNNWIFHLSVPLY